MGSPEEATCKFHFQVPRRDRIANLLTKIVTIKEDPSGSLPPELNGKKFTLLTKTDNWRPLLICAGCYRGLSKPDGTHKALTYQTAFKAIRSGDDKRRVREAGLRYMF